MYSLPEQRAELVADYAVEYAARLLRVYKILVYLSRVLYRVTDSTLRYLVKGNTADLLRRDIERRNKMPRYRLSLAVGVGCEIDLIGILRFLFQLGDKRTLAAYVYIFRLEAVFYIYSECALRQVAYVTYRRYHLIAGAEIILDRSRLGRRLNYNKM